MSWSLWTSKLKCFKSIASIWRHILQVMLRLSLLCGSKDQKQCLQRKTLQTREMESNREKRGKAWKVGGKVANKWEPQIDLDLGDSARNALHAAESQKLRPQKLSARPRLRFPLVLAFSWFSCGLPLGVFYGLCYGFSTCLLCVTWVAVSAAVRLLRKCIPIFARRAATMPHAHSGTLTHTLAHTHTHTRRRHENKNGNERTKIPQL